MTGEPVLAMAIKEANRSFCWRRNNRLEITSSKRASRAYEAGDFQGILGICGLRAHHIHQLI